MEARVEPAGEPFRDLLDALPCAVARLRAQGRVEFANPAARAALGERCVGAPLEDLLLPRAAGEAALRLMRGGGGEFKCATAETGARAAYAARLAPLPDGFLLSLHATGADAAEAECAGRAMRDLEADRSLLRDKVERGKRDLADADRRFATLFDGDAEPLLLLSRSLDARRINRAARERYAPFLAGRRDASLLDLFPGGAHAALRDTARRDGGELSLFVEYPDGRRAPVRVRLEPLSADELLARLGDRAAAGEENA